MITENGVTADGHNGMDYGAKKGTRINAIKDGTVTKVEKNPDNSRGYGLYVEITHTMMEPIHYTDIRVKLM